MVLSLSHSLEFAEEGVAEDVIVLGNAVDAVGLGLQQPENRGAIDVPDLLFVRPTRSSLVLSSNQLLKVTSYRVAQFVSSSAVNDLNLCSNVI